MKKLTPKQQRFVDHYDGDARSTAEKCGLNYAYCRQLLTMEKHSHVQAALAKRETTESNRRIYNRQQRQEFWSQMMRSSEKASDRLKASELLGKSQADFVERKRLEDADGGPLEIKMSIGALKEAMEEE